MSAVKLNKLLKELSKKEKQFSSPQKMDIKICTLFQEQAIYKKKKKVRLF